MSEYRGHAEVICETMKLTSFDGVVALGGDGTLHECVNGMMKRSKPLRKPIGSDDDDDDDDDKEEEEEEEEE